MRNLLSFVCGLLVSLLYGLVRAILLLDRLICAIYDLPLWSRLAGAAEQIGRRRGLCALAVFVPLLFVPGALLTRAGTLVLADGRPLGLIEDAAALPAAVTALEQSASALAGRGLHASCVDQKPGRCARPRRCSSLRRSCRPA